MSWVTSHEPVVRLAFFAGVFLVMSVWEAAAPRRRLRAAKGGRWFANLGIVVTPDMHRVHHLIKPFETNSNFGFNLPWCDWLLGTYRNQPEDGHDAMTIGLSQFQDRPRQSFPWLLAVPFTGRIGGHPMGK